MDSVTTPSSAVMRAERPTRGGRPALRTFQPRKPPFEIAVRADHGCHRYRDRIAFLAAKVDGAAGCAGERSADREEIVGGLGPVEIQRHAVFKSQRFGMEDTDFSRRVASAQRPGDGEVAVGDRAGARDMRKARGADVLPRSSTPVAPTVRSGAAVNAASSVPSATWTRPVSATSSINVSVPLRLVTPPSPSAPPRTFGGSPRYWSACRSPRRRSAR